MLSRGEKLPPRTQRVAADAAAPPAIPSPVARAAAQSAAARRTGAVAGLTAASR